MTRRNLLALAETCDPSLFADLGDRYGAGRLAPGDAALLRECKRELYAQALRTENWKLATVLIRDGMFGDPTVVPEKTRRRLLDAVAEHQLAAHLESA
jgi:hypothetical protein